MVKIKQNINKNQITATSSKTGGAVIAGTDASIYYSNLSKEWACKMPASVDGTEYSAKYYMEKTKQEAIDSKSELQDLCSQNIIDLQSAGDEILDSVTEIYNQTADKADEIMNLTLNSADIDLSNITSTAINKIMEYGQSRNIGEIVASAIPLTDAGLHLLDGALISGSGSYSAFVDYIAGLVADYPDLFDTEANWQSAVTQYGVCGKFVYDSANNTVRLPKITGIVEGTTDVTALGDLVEAGLPNITGSVYNSSTGAGDQFSDIATVSSLGALSDIRSTVGRYGITNGTTTYTNMWDGISFDASNSNATYGNSSTVQPQTIKVLYYIAIATSAKTQIQVDIDEIATDSNGKADVDGSNMVNSVKNFDGQWVNSYLQLASSVAISTSADQTYSLSSYLPNDGYNYEVLVGANISVTTNSKYCNIYAHTDLISGSAGIVGGSKSGTNYSFYSCGSAVLIVGTGRTITIIKGSTTNSEGTYTLNVYGYRRIGTNQ